MKKNQLKKIMAIFLLAVFVSGVLCGCSVLEQVEELASETETESELADGQRRAKITVVSITGNELTYYEEETEAEPESEWMTEEAGNAGENAAQSGSGGRQRGNMPDMSQMSSGGSMPDMSRMDSGEMPDMSQMSSGASMPDMSRMGSGRTAGRQTVTVYLPVAVTVHTGISSTATFSILEAGDELTVLFETAEDGSEVITEIWMEGSGG